MMSGLALPYDTETVIGELSPSGGRSVYREVFDRESWAELPDRVPFLRSHQRQSSPLGWARLDSQPSGLHVLIEPVAGSGAAADAVAEVRSGELTGLSVGFCQSPDQDMIDAKDRRRLPLIRRRGCTLVEVSLALGPAYRGAEILSVDVDADAHAESERELAPVRQQLAQEAADRRQSDQELLSWVDQLTAQRDAVLTAPIPPAPDGLTSGVMVRGYSGAAYVVVEDTNDYDAAVCRVESFEQERAVIMRPAAVDPRRIDALAARYRLRSVV